MMKNSPILCAWAAIWLAVLPVGAAVDQKHHNALKVEQLLQKIEKHHSPSGRRDQTAEITERELNDYIGYRIAREKKTAITRINVRLLENNQLQGKIVLDARRLNLDLLFGEAMDFDFKGLLNTRRGEARLDLRALLLHGRPVSPQTLDLVVSAISLYSGTKPSRIDDWYPLPKGIDRIIVKRGRADLLY